MFLDRSFAGCSRRVLPLSCAFVAAASLRAQSYCPAGSFPAGHQPVGVRAGDLDGDGDLDLVVSNLNSSNVSILLNQGAGTFAAPSPLTTAFSPRGLVLVDFDNDGDLDVATSTANGVSVLINSGGGSFAPYAFHGTPPGALSLDTGDLDGDGLVDLVVVGFDNGATNAGWISILHNQGSGTFAPASSFQVAQYPNDVAVADMNGDGMPDLVTLRAAASTVEMYPNTGGVTFGMPTSFPTGLPATALTLGDFDGDGDIDVAFRITDAHFDGVELMTNSGSGALMLAAVQGGGSGISDMVASDIDGDGDLDLVTTNYAASSHTILRNQGNGTFVVDPPVPTFAPSQALTVADLDGDGQLDLVAANSASDTVSFDVRCAASPVLYCAGDGSGSACPCGNSSPAGSQAGCLDSFGAAGRLRTQGIARLSQDTLVLAGDSMPNAAALYFQGTQPTNGGAGVVFGDGLRCASGSVVRMGTHVNASGHSQYPGPGESPVHVRGNVTAPGSRYYQVWYRNAAAFCTSDTFNLTNGVRIDWTL
jgi:hypothetical protein